jgi:hypothetical protein
MAERLDIGDDLAAMEDRNRAAEVGQVARSKPSLRYVSFIRNTSPGCMVSGGKSRTTAFGIAE